MLINKSIFGWQVDAIYYKFDNLSYIVKLKALNLIIYHESRSGSASNLISLELRFEDNVIDSSWTSCLERQIYIKKKITIIIIIFYTPQESHAIPDVPKKNL